MKIVFMGTPEFAACFLKHLKESDFADVVAVVTQPDRPAGRGRVLTPPPVKQLALEFGLPVLQPTDLKSSEFESALRAFDADLFVVVAYSILPKNILAVAKFGAVNVHGSLLPKYRGAAPVQRAIADGLKETGVTVFRLDEKMDHGPILAQKVVAIDHQDTTASLLEKMVAPGCEALDEAIHQLMEGREKDLTQDHAQASGAPRRSFTTASAPSIRGRAVTESWAAVWCTSARRIRPRTVRSLLRVLWNSRTTACSSVRARAFWKSLKSRLKARSRCPSPTLCAESRSAKDFAFAR